MHDLVIRGGTVVDGTGGDRFSADVAIDGGVIADVGRVTGPGREEIDADGLLVTPGFVDIHTHYDGQVSWDPYLTPSSLHGVTTVVMGNCGVGFAPIRPDHHDFLISLMEGVEDIPGTALAEGITWEWESFPEYLDAVERVPHALDIGAQVPHGALRAYVMGERGAAREDASADEIDEMTRLTREAIGAGALGFTTSRTVRHRTSAGDYTPSLGAVPAELWGIGRALADVGAGVFELVSDFEDFEGEFAMIRELAGSTGRPLSVSLSQHDAVPDGWREFLKRIDEANDDGMKVTAQVACRAIGVMLGLEASLHPFVAHPSYGPLHLLPLAEKVARMSDPDTRAQILSEEPAFGGPFRQFAESFHKMFALGDPADYEPAPDQSAQAIAEARGVRPEEVVYDMLLARDGHELIYYPLFNYAHGNLDAAREMMLHEHTVLGLSDGGAHCGAICDASFPTTLLTLWARDRTRGERLPLEWVVRAQTRETAEAVGLCDRGLVAPGFKADLNVIDFDNLELPPPRIVHDLPAGGKRLTQGARGYTATVCSGTVTFREGEPTGALPGRLVRGAQPTLNAAPARSG
ncbi:MAG: amidohydrolase family protein [Actinobacteria bacterium]|nr:amidohydrolase family protein [Actinomycetota bacterium]